MKYSMKAALSTFLFTNMAPQNKIINEKSWNALERKIEDFGRGNNIFVVTGVCMKDRLIKPEVSVKPPKCFWKLICAIVEENVSVVSFYQDNNVITNNKITKFTMMSQSALSNIIQTTGIKTPYLNDLWNNEIIMKMLTRNSEIEPAKCRDSMDINEEQKNFWNAKFAVPLPSYADPLK